MKKKFKIHNGGSLKKIMVQIALNKINKLKKIDRALFMEKMEILLNFAYFRHVVLHHSKIYHRDFCGGNYIHKYG